MPGLADILCGDLTFMPDVDGLKQEHRLVSDSPRLRSRSVEMVNAASALLPLFSIND